MVSDGEQRKYHNFWTYCVHGLPNMAPDGFKIPFSAGHTRRMPRLTGGPFRYGVHADRYLVAAQKYASVPVKQAVISPSALSLLYPASGIPEYSREQFIDDLLNEHEAEVRSCLSLGAHAVQIDFTEGRLAVKLDPSGELLAPFIALNNLALGRFSSEERKRIGVHTCPGGPRLDAQCGRRLCGTIADPASAKRWEFLCRAGSRARPKTSPAHHSRIPASGATHFHRCDGAHRSEAGDDRRSALQDLGSRRIHPARAAGHQRRLWLFPILRRYVDHARAGIRKDPGSSPWHRVRRSGTRRELVDDEDELLRSVALQNTQVILSARLRTEEELRKTRETLEEKTRVLELLNKTGALFASKLELEALVQTEHPTARTPLTFQAEIVLTGLKVLVVDDDPDARELLRVVLNAAQAEVISAAFAAEALALVRSVRPDVVVSDIGMPDCDVFQFMRAVRTLPATEGGKTPSIALTAFARSEDRTRALLAGYQSHVAKPIEPHELIVTIGSVTGRT